MTYSSQSVPDNEPPWYETEYTGEFDDDHPYDIGKQ